MDLLDCGTNVVGIAIKLSKWILSSRPCPVSSTSDPSMDASGLRMGMRFDMSEVDGDSGTNADLLRCLLVAFSAVLLKLRWITGDGRLR